MIGSELEVFVCEDCDNQVIRIQGSGEALCCCEKPMKMLVPNSTDASSGKHIPVYEFIGNSDMLIRVGSTDHPMTPEHHIGWIAVVYENTIIHEAVSPDMAPQSTIQLNPGNTGKIYAWCNLHGLWSADF